MPPDAAVLVYWAERAHRGVVLYRHVAGQRCAVGEDTVVADAGVVADVRVSHDQAIAAHVRCAATARGPARDGDALTDHRTVANLHAGWLAGILQILWGNAD